MAASAAAIRAAKGMAPNSVMAGDDLRRAYMLGLVGAGNSDVACDDDDVDGWPDDDFELRGDFWK